MNLNIYTDGGSRGNPGQAAVGVVVYNGEDKIDSISKKIGVATNNIAEYQAVLEALVLVRDKYNPNNINFFIDSELVVRQLNGIYKIKNVDLKRKYLKILELMSEIGCKVTYTHIKREKNKEADGLVNEALDKNN